MQTEPLTRSKKTAVGLTGTVSKISDWNGNYIASETFDITTDDKQYPMTDWNREALDPSAEVRK